MNNDYLGGARCPQTFLPCPLRPIVLASAFSQSGFSGDAGGGAVYLGGPAVQMEHTTFPSYTNDSTVQNIHAYSVHSYGEYPRRLSIAPFSIVVAQSGGGRPLLVP